MVVHVVMLFMFVGIVEGTLHKINQLATGNGLKVGLLSSPLSHVRVMWRPHLFRNGVR